MCPRIWRASPDSVLPYDVKNRLKSLQLNISRLRFRSWGKLLSLRSCDHLESLDVTCHDIRVNPRPHVMTWHRGKGILKCLLQLSLMGSLIHLHMHFKLSHIDVSNILSNCSKLETLKIAHVDSFEYVSREYALELSTGNLPQRLRTVSFRLQDSIGLGGLMELLFACSSLKDLRIYPACGEVLSTVTPTRFSTQLLTDPAKWQRITSFFLYVRNRAEWRHLRARILPRMTGLKTLCLLFGAAAEDLGEEEEEEDDDDAIPMPHLEAPADDVNHRIENLDLRSTSPSLFARRQFWKRLFSHWNSILHLSVFAMGHDLEDADFIDFYDFIENAPSRLDELKLHIILSVSRRPDVPASMADRLRCLKKLTMPNVRFGARSFAALVTLCPLVEIFKVGYAFPFFSGLRLDDLPSVSAWSRLKECLLIVNVDCQSVASVPPVDTRLPFAQMLVIVKDAELIPRLKREWSASLTRLQRMEINISFNTKNCDVSVDVSGKGALWPLIFASRCGLGRLHFT